MKKVILTVVAVMTFTLSFAENGTENNAAFGGHRAVNVENYDMSFDMRRLAAKLDLTADQMEAVQVIQDNFNTEMLSAATARGFERRHLVHQAVRKDARQMQRVLNDKQFGTYMMLLGTTLQNKGL